MPGGAALRRLRPWLTLSSPQTVCRQRCSSGDGGGDQGGLLRLKPVLTTWQHYITAFRAPFLEYLWNCRDAAGMVWEGWLKDLAIHGDAWGFMAILFGIHASQVPHVHRQRLHGGKHSKLWQAWRNAFAVHWRHMGRLLYQPDLNPKHDQLQTSTLYVINYCLAHSRFLQHNFN